LWRVSSFATPSPLFQFQEGWGWSADEVGPPPFSEWYVATGNPTLDLGCVVGTTGTQCGVAGPIFFNVTSVGQV